MIVPNSGPHIVDHLNDRIRSLSAALDAAQDRINELERAFGSDAELMPLIIMGLTPTHARIAHLLRTRDFVTGEQVQFAMYAENPDHIHDVDARGVMKVHITYMRRCLKRFGVEIESIGYGKGSAGYRMDAPSKARLAHVLATGCRLALNPARKARKPAAVQKAQRHDSKGRFSHVDPTLYPSVRMAYNPL